MTTDRLSPLASDVLAKLGPPPSEAEMWAVCPRCSSQQRLSDLRVDRDEAMTAYFCPMDEALVARVVPLVSHPGEWAIQAQSLVVEIKTTPPN